MDLKKLKAGMKVFIKRGLKNSVTRDRFKLDEYGQMLKMQGRVCKVKYVDAMENKARLYVPSDCGSGDFVFDASDIIEPKEYSKKLPPLPDPVLFDIERLDI